MENKFEYEVIPHLVVVSRVNEMTLTIRNKTGTSIHIDNVGKRSAEDYPDIDEPVVSDNPQGFYISFPYGNDGGDMATVAKSQEIQLRISDPALEAWECAKKTSSKNATYFLVVPKRSMFFENGTSLSLTFLIECNHVVGNTSVSVKFDGIEKSVAIKKVEKPVIKKFEPKERLLQKGEATTMVWSVDNDENCQISINDIDVTGKTEYKYKIESKEAIKLIVKELSTGIKTEKSFLPPYITSFTVKRAGANQLKARNAAAVKNTNQILSNIKGDFIDPTKLSALSLKEIALQAYAGPSFQLMSSKTNPRDLDLSWSAKNVSHCIIAAIGSSQLPAEGSSKLIRSTETYFVLQAIKSDGFQMNGVVHLHD